METIGHIQTSSPKKMSSFRKRTESGVGAFRPIASASGCNGSDATNYVPYCTIFRVGAGGKGTDDTDVDSCSDDSFVMSIPGHSWPPHNIPGSESADSSKFAEKALRRRKLDRQLPLQEESPMRNSKSSTQGSPPSYYLIEMQGSNACLLSGDDNSVQITPDHNKRIVSSKGKNMDLIRASQIVQPATSGDPSTPKRDEMSLSHVWSVTDSGIIQVVSNISHGGNNVCKTPPASVKKESCHPGNDSNMPILAKASSDSNDTKSEDGFILESPPRMTREKFDSSFLQDDISRHSSSGRRSTSSKSHRSNQSLGSGGSNRASGCGLRGQRDDFVSVLLDFFSSACCQSTVNKRSETPTSSISSSRRRSVAAA